MHGLVGELCVYQNSAEYSLGQSLRACSRGEPEMVKPSDHMNLGKKEEMGTRP